METNKVLKENYNDLKMKVAGMKAVAENNRRALDSNLAKFQDIINNIPDNTKNRLKEFGIDTTPLETIDYSRLKVDADYMQEVSKYLTMIIMKCKEIAERALS